MCNLRSLAVALFLSLVPTAATSQASVRDASVSLARLDVAALVPVNPKPDYDKAVLEPLRHSQEVKAAKEKADALEAARQATEALQLEQARLAREAQELADRQVAQVAATVHPAQAVSYDLIGSLGYSLPYGNCVNEPGVNNPGYGNPINWPVTSNTPWLGATVLFTFNHVAVATGMWSNGDIEVRQQNSPGMSHRIPRGMIRGYR